MTRIGALKTIQFQWNVFLGLKVLIKIQRILNIQSDVSITAHCSVNEFEIIIIPLEQMRLMANLYAQRNFGPRRKSILSLFFFPTRCLHFWINTFLLTERAIQPLFNWFMAEFFLYRIECKHEVVKATDHYKSKSIDICEECVTPSKHNICRSFLCCIKNSIPTNNIYPSAQPRCIINIHGLCSQCEIKKKSSSFSTRYRAHEVDWEKPSSFKQNKR